MTKDEAEKKDISDLIIDIKLPDPRTHTLEEAVKKIVADYEAQLGARVDEITIH